MIGFDTNVLVYAFARGYPEKGMVCKKLVRDVIQGELHGVLPAQVLAEFAYICRTKTAVPHEQITSILEAITTSENWTVPSSTPDDVVRASQEDEFWDALIEQTLLRNGVDELVTENTADFDRIATTDVLDVDRDPR